MSLHRVQHTYADPSQLCILVPSCYYLIGVHFSLAYTGVLILVCLLCPLAVQGGVLRLVCDQDVRPVLPLRRELP
jgi:hypothetical protein